MPFYWAGTNCYASGNAMVHPPPHGETEPAFFVEGALWIGSYKVREFLHTPGEPGAMSLGFHAVFDSAYFPYDYPLVVQFEGRDSYGRWYIANGSARVKNRALLYNHPEFDDYAGGQGSLAAYQALWGTHYDISHRNVYPWTDSAYFADMWRCNIAYVNTHGSIEVHEDGAVSTNYITPQDYYGARFMHIGIGYPPFNSSGEPPINLLLLEACNAGGANFAEALHPMWNVYGGYLTNQTFLGYVVYVAIEQAEARTGILFSALMEGLTVAWAQYELLQYGGEDGIVVWDVHPGPTRPIGWTDLELAGDRCTRIRTVYTGDNRLPIGWYY